MMQYVTSCYWAVVTIATVGYGDITPTNTEEVEANILIILIGVTFYSYIVSRVTTIFNASQEVEQSVKREKEIEDFINKKINTDELQAITRHFYKITKEDKVIKMFDHNNLGQLLSILPIHLKSETNYFMYKEAIDTIKILQDKDQRFYSEFIT
jgi:hypothetical protein